ncbi:MAG: TIGR02281 family clan AA aspartic protease [Erythrobacter sp.]|nr:TIGR02281 family clan AA aspartic protease [Erythrobacter sp.]
MRESALLIVAIAAFIASAFVPGGAVDTATHGEDRTALAVETPSLAEPSPTPTFLAPGEIAVPRSADGQFYTEARVNDRPIRFLVDTGATGVALTGEDARVAGIHWSPTDLEIVAQGASGPVEGVRMTIDTIELGDHEIRDFNAVIVPQGLPVSLLGQSFLSRMDAMRIEGDRMVIGN